MIDSRNNFDSVAGGEGQDRSKRPESPVRCKRLKLMINQSWSEGDGNEDDRKDEKASLVRQRLGGSTPGLPEAGHVTRDFAAL